MKTTAGEFVARNVVVATGPFGSAETPPPSKALSPDIVQIHSNEYRNPGQLPPGAVLVVGSGASGFQIAEDLLDAGRHVYFSLGRHEARPRRYRGEDIAYWMSLTGAWDRKLEDNSEAFFAPRSALTGAGG